MKLPWRVSPIFLILVSCGHVSTPVKQVTVSSAVEESKTTQLPTQVAEVQRSDRSVGDIENLTIEEVIRLEEPNTQNLYDNSRYDFPITVNARVEGWIDYFTGRGRPHMERYLARSSRYIPMMRVVFKKAGLPEDLVYLALIESGFNMLAKSRAKAVGPWQFMKATGKRYGLRVDAWVDERRDPIRSTDSAARYLKDLYLMFESWYLAAAAYNAGEYKVLRAIESVKTNNYWKISQTRAFRRETKDYIPKLIAAAIIAKNPQRYGFHDVEYLQPFAYEKLVVDFPIHLKDIASAVKVKEEELIELNPELRRGIVPPGVAYEVRIPSGSRRLAERALASLKSQVAKLDLPKQHTIKAGETLASISQRYKVRRSELANINNIGSRESLIPGSVLILPSKNRKGFDVASDDDVVEKGQGYIIHKVRSGESLWSISEKYNVTVQELFRWNGLKGSSIHPGKKLRIQTGVKIDPSKRSADLARQRS